jgi:hypothetical protein
MGCRSPRSISTRECRLCAEAVQRVENWLSERRQLWEDRFDHLGQLLENGEIKGDTP